MTFAKKHATTQPMSRSKTRKSRRELRQTYQKPHVRPVGKVAQTIMSPSPGTFESGVGAGRRGSEA
jgi:hypothetical protein